MAAAASFMICLACIANAWAVPAQDFEGAWIAHFDQQDSNLFANILQMVNPFAGPEVFVFEKGHVFIFGAIVGPDKVFRIDLVSNDGRELDASVDPQTDYDGKTNSLAPATGPASIRLHAVLSPDRTGMAILWKEGVEERRLSARLDEGQLVALEQLHALEADLATTKQATACPTSDQDILQSKVVNLQKQLAECKASWTATQVTAPATPRCPAVPGGRVINIDGASVIGNDRVQLRENPNQGRLINIVGRTSLRGPNLQVRVNGQPAQMFGSCGDFSAALERTGEIRQVHVEAESGDGKSASLTVSIVQ